MALDTLMKEAEEVKMQSDKLCEGKYIYVVTTQTKKQRNKLTKERITFSFTCI